MNLFSILLFAVWLPSGTTLSDPCQNGDLRIRKVHIQTLGVFDSSHSEFKSFPFRIANKLHFKTRKSFIRNELLFKESDRCVADLLRESERNLRRYTFLTDVSIKAERVNAQEVDVVVRSEDQWTTRPIVSLGKTRGSRTIDLGFSEENFLGLGKKVTLQYDENLERRGFSIGVTDPRFLDTRLRLNTTFGYFSDGHRAVVGITQPFYAQSTPWSYGISMNDLKRTQHLYFQGKDAAELDHTEHVANLSVNRAFGPRYKRIRVGFSFGYSESLFHDTRILDPVAAEKETIKSNLDPDEHRLLLAGTSLERDYQRFAKFSYIDSYGRTEDFPTGLLTSVGVFVSRDALGSDFVTGALTGRWAAQKNRQQYFVASATTQIRKQQDRWNNLIADLFLHYYLQSGALNLGLFKSPRQTFAANLSGTLTKDVDAPFQLALGEEEGLRGYSFKTFTGSNRVLMNLEHRIFTNWENRLFGIGIVPFFDAGYVWGNGDDNWGMSTGIGVRLGFKKYGRTKVFRLDIGYPLANADRSGFSISVTTGQVFDVL